MHRAGHTQEFLLHLRGLKETFRLSILQAGIYILCLK